MDPHSDLSEFPSFRLNRFQSSLVSLIQRIAQDELLSQFSQNPISQDFQLDRIKEMVEEALNLEQEASIESLMKTNVFLKGEIKRLEDEQSKKNEESLELRQQILRLESEKEKQRKIVEILERENKGLIEKNRINADNQAQILEIKEQQLNYEKSMFSQEMNSLKIEIQDLNEKLTIQKREIGLKEDKIIALSAENLALQGKVADRAALLSENDSLKRRLQEKNQEKTVNEGHFIVRSQDFEGQMIRKTQEFEEYKQRNAEKIANLKSVLKEKEQALEDFSFQTSVLNDRLQRELEVKAELEEKLKKLQNEAIERQRQSELSREKNLQNEDLKRIKHEKDWESKLKNTERELRNSFQNERSEFQAKILDLESNSIPITELLKKQKEFEKAVEEIKSRAEARIKEYEGQIRSKLETEKGLERVLQQTSKEIDLKNEIIQGLEQENGILKAEVKELKMNEAKLKDTKKKSESQAVEDERRENQRLNREIKAKELEMQESIAAAAKLKEKIRVVNKEKEEVMQERSLLQEDKLELEAKIIALTHDKKSFEIDLGKEKTSSIALQREIESLRNELRDREIAIRGLQEKSFQELRTLSQRNIEENEDKFREIEKLKLSNDKLERTHREILNQLKLKDSEISLLSQRLQESSEETKLVEDLRTNNVRLKEQLLKRNRQLADLKAKITEIRVFLSNSRICNLKTNFLGFVKAVKLTLEGFREGLTDLGRAFEAKAGITHRMFVKRQDENVSFFNESLRKYEFKLQKLSEQFQSEVGSLQRKSKAFEEEYERANERNRELCEEKSVFVEKIEGLTEENEELRRKVVKQNEEIAMVRENYSTAMVEFSSQQNLTKRSVERIRNEMKTLFKRKMQEMDKVQKKELLALNLKIRELKESHIEILNTLRDDVESMQYETAKTKGMNKELEIRTREIEELKEKITLLCLENVLRVQNLLDTKLEDQTSEEVLVSEIEGLKRVIKDDEERLLELKRQTKKEIEGYKMEITEMKKELQKKEGVIKSLKRVKEDQDEKLKDLKTMKRFEKPSHDLKDIVQRNLSEFEESRASKSDRYLNTEELVRKHLRKRDFDWVSPKKKP